MFGKMLRIVGLSCIVVLGIAMIVSRYATINSPPPGYLIQEQGVSVEQKEMESVIHEVNKINSRILTFTCDDIDIFIQDKNVKLRASACVNYQKERMFNMIISSLLGSEIELGSNNDHFWFWSKRLDAATLYYANYRDVYKTRLKTPFHPLWIKSNLGLDIIKDNKIIYACRRGKNWELVQEDVTVQGKKAIISTIINPESKTIIGRYVYENNQLIISSEVYEQVNRSGFVLPSKIVTHWYQEGITLVWKINNPSVNLPLKPSLWKMPQKRKMLDMGI